MTVYPLCFTTVCHEVLQWPFFLSFPYVSDAPNGYSESVYKKNAIVFNKGYLYVDELRINKKIKYMPLDFKVMLVQTQNNNETKQKQKSSPFYKSSY